MEHKQGSRIWRNTQKLYGVLLLAYINILDEMTEPVWSKHTMKCFSKSASMISADVYAIIHDSGIEVDWEYLGIDKPMLRHMEKEWLTPTNYLYRIGAYPSN